MALSKVSSMNSLFSQIYEDAIFTARENNLMTNLVTVYASQGLASRYLPIYPALSASEVSEGTDFSAATEWTKTAQMTLTPKIVKTQVVLTEARIATDPDDARRDAAVELGGAIATKIDSDLVDLFSGFSVSKGTAGSALTLANVAAGMSVLQNSKARAPFSVVLHPYQWYDIWVALGSPATNQAFLGEVANMAMREFAVQRMLNADWYTSANITVDGSDDANGAVFNREALAFDNRQAPVMIPDFDASIAGGGAYELNMESWYAVGERRDSFGVKIISDASTPS